MFARLFLPLLSTLALVLALAFPASSSENDELAAQARDLSKSFGGQLKAQLQQGMKQGGPLVALDVCNVQAPAIAQAVGDTAGWKVGRTSMKARNEDNRPDMWELTTLLEFEKQKELGNDLTTLESYAIVETDDGRVFRYMKAIPTGDVCLACHGDNVPENVLAKIHQLYPADQALGFKAGDIRGAFTLSKQLD